MSVPCHHAYGAKVAGSDTTQRPSFETTQRRWPDPKTGPYEISIYWGRAGSRAIPVGMTIMGAIDHGDRTTTLPALSTTVLRSLKLAEIVTEDRERLDHIEPEPPTPAEVIEGMRPATVRRLKRAAEIYKKAWSAGESPTQAVARKMNVSAAAAGNLVRRARQAGFLPPTSGGVPQG